MLKCGNTLLKWRIFRYNDGCAPGITALAVSAVPSLMKNINSLPAGFLNTLFTTLLEATKVR